MANLTEQETAMETDFEKELQLAEQGDADTQVAVGLSYQYGRGTNKNSAQAIEWLKKAAMQGHEFGQYFLGWMYFKNKDFIQAANWLEKAAEQGNKEAQILLVRVCLENITVTQNFSQAIKWLDTVLTNAPKFIDELISKTISDAEDKKDNFSTYYWSREIEKYYALPEYERIVEAYRKLLANQFKRPKFTQTNNLEKLAYQEGATAKIQFVAGILCSKDNLPIVDLIKQAAERGETDAQYILADFYFDGLFGVENNQALAWQWFKKAQQQNNDNFYTEVKWFEKKAEEGNANSYIKRADAYYSYFRATHDDSNKKLDLFRKALADYTKAIELNPNEADFYIKRADAYHNYGYELYYYDDYDTLCKSDIFYKALNDYTKAIELNPNCYNAYYARAMFHQQVDYFFICDEQALNAIPDYTKVIELAPDEDYAYYNRAQCYQFLKEYNKAIADYSKSIELNDKHNIYCERGYCYEELKEYDKAIADYSKDIEMDYPVSFPYFRRANCYHNLKKYDEALADYSKGFKLGRGITPRDFFNGGELYKELGDYERAFKCFDYGIKSCKDSKDKEKYARLAHDTAMSINDYNRAKNYLEQLTSLEEHKEVYLGNIDKAEQLEQLNKQLDEKNKELNNLIAMFAHNFLGTLQCIRSNAEHDNNAKIHLKTVKMMSGALTAFSIISADDDKLIEQLKQDNTGETNLLQNLANNLALAISQLLSKTNKDKIINLYLNYLRKTNQIETDTTSEELRENKDYRKKWQALQHQWEDEFNVSFSENVELSSLQTWLADNFFPVQITGFDNYNIRFKEYGITDSIFLVVFMEILVNALKYMDVSQNKPLILTLEKQDQHYHLICENPSSQETYRGTHKGMDFLKSIARKLNVQFITESTEQQFKTTFIIPAELLD